MAAVGGGGPVVVDGAAGGGHAAAELGDQRLVARDGGIPVEPLGEPGLGLGVADRDRPDRTERAAHGPARRVDDERAAGDGDDHGVAHADLEELLGPAATGTSTATTSSPGSSAVRLGPVRKASTGRVRRPAADASSTVAPRATSTGSVSPAGEAVARLPPIVPVLRIWGLPTVRAAWASAGSRVGQVGTEQPGEGGARRQHDDDSWAPDRPDGVSRSVRGPDRRGGGAARPPAAATAPRRGAGGRS